MEKKIHKIDATGKVAGRLASQIAVLLQGKHKSEYQPNHQVGDMVEVTNVKDMKFSGKKLTTKLYHHPTGYIGNLRTQKLDDLMAKKPEEVLRKMVYLMLPKNKLRPKMIKQLTIK